MNQCTARERPRLPLRGLAFERRQWRKQRERQAAAVRKCKANAEARAVNGEGAKVSRRIKDRNAVTEGEIHRVCAKAVSIDEHKTKIVSV